MYVVYKRNRFCADKHESYIHISVIIKLNLSVFVPYARPVLRGSISNLACGILIPSGWPQAGLRALALRLYTPLQMGCELRLGIRN